MTQLHGFERYLEFCNHSLNYMVNIFIVAPCILKIHLLSHTNKCTNHIIYYLKSILIIDIKTLSYFHSSYMFRHITCHPQGALMFLAKITGKTIRKTWTYIVWRVWQHIMNCRHLASYFHFNDKSKIFQSKTQVTNKHKKWERTWKQFNFLERFYCSYPF
jgi:hypothetical protein